MAFQGFLCPATNVVYAISATIQGPLSSYVIRCLFKYVYNKDVLPRWKERFGGAPVTPL